MRTFPAGVLACLLALAVPALAQNAKDGGKAAAEPAPDVIKVYDDNTLKPEDIRACLKSDAAISDMEAKLDDYKKTVADFRAKIDELAAELDRRRKQIDGTDPDAVADYNRRVDRHAEMVERYNGSFLPNLKGRRKKLNAAIETYNSDCAEKSYFEEDWLAAVKELGIEDPRPKAGGGK